LEAFCPRAGLQKRGDREAGRLSTSLDKIDSFGQYGQVKNHPKSQRATPDKREVILNAAIRIFGKSGFKKTSIEDLADAADISKQGLYLHFSSKEEIFQAANQKYLEDGLSLVQQELDKPDAALFQRLMGAMDAWFGRHLATFTPRSFDVIEAGERLSGSQIEEFKVAFKEKLAKAIARSFEFKSARNVCTPKEISEVLFMFGLTWKEGNPSRADFMKRVNICIRACCQIEERRRRT
jgi:TetR/AcrR family transcriptional regulator, regulator of autoinduction and epiphytic fitness